MEGQRRRYVFDNDVELLVHIVVRYAQNAPAMLFHEGITDTVSHNVFVGPMGNSVHFDNQLFSHAGEIDDKRTDGMLSAKVMSDPVTAQFRPKDRFRIRQATAQAFGESS